jgi:hypothetical protein
MNVAKQATGAEKQQRWLATVRRHGGCGSPEKRKKALCGCSGRTGLVRASLRGARHQGERGDAVALAGDSSTTAAASGGKNRKRRKTEDDGDGNI